CSRVDTSSLYSCTLSLHDALPISGGHGLDYLCIQTESDESLLAFLHLSEKAAAGRFAIYRDVVQDDPSIHAVFEEILHDEVFHIDRKSTRLNSSHEWISYAVCCLK